MALKKICAKTGCKELTSERYCEEHRKEKNSYDQDRGTAYERGYDARWQRVRKQYLKKHPLCACEDCKRLVVPLPANVVDHIIPHKGNKELFWDRSNWQPMNHRCHNRKTAKYDGGSW